MKVDEKWRDLGWKHPLWDYIRFYSVVQRQRKAVREAWEDKMRGAVMEIDSVHDLRIPEQHAELFFDYLKAREADFTKATEVLRTEEEADEFCLRIGAEPSRTSTRNRDHHQSSAAMVAAVSRIAESYCSERGLGVSLNPTRRAVWLEADRLHVTARNLDGAIPSLDSPKAVWEIKEYWGKTKGGSKMSDAVYECALVGRELRGFEDGSGLSRVSHIVFLDGKEQWSHRKSDLKRFIDLFHQGFIDHLLIGSEVEEDWGILLRQMFA